MWPCSLVRTVAGGGLLKKSKGNPADRRRKPVTLADIGREASVSSSVVSRVLRNRGERIPEATREKIRVAAHRLGYRPNLLIQGVQTGRSMNIGVVVPSTGSFYSRIVHGIHDEFRKNHYCILLAWNPEDTHAPNSDLELELIHSLLDRRADGIILRPAHSDVSDLYFSEVQERGVPMVTVDRPLPGVSCDFSGTDDELGARMAARCLLESGHRNLVHLSAASSFAPGSLRQKGFEQECAGAGVSHCRTVTIPENADPGTCQRAALEILSVSARPTALFLASDDMAPGVYRAARQLNLRIPEEVSIMGFGDLEKGEYLDPPLSSVHQHPYRIGQNAARMILKRIGGHAGEIKSFRTKPAVVKRESIALI